MNLGSTLHLGGRSPIKSVGHPQRRTLTNVPKRGTVVVVFAKSNSNDRQRWEFSRFLKTLAFFDALPTPDKIITGLIKTLTGSSSSSSSSSSSLPPSITVLIPPPTNMPLNKDVTLITGATGGVGKRVIALLLQRGHRVRALVRDLPKAQQLLSSLSSDPTITTATGGGGGSLELIAADLTQPATLLPEMFTNVKAVISAAAVKVVPKEGDTIDRKKYYQGIKFYDPEIVGDTPESVEYEGMKSLLGMVGGKLGGKGNGGGILFSASLASSLSPGSSPGSKGTTTITEFGALDDVVMGGVSSSGFTIQPNAGEVQGNPAGVFAGNVTSANNGGFASVRSRNISPPADLGAYDGVQLRIKGDGQRYKLVLRTTEAWDGVGYTVSFDTVADTWQTVKIPFSSFKAIFRAKSVLDAPPLNAGSIVSVQLMLSKFEYDGKLNPAWREGRFELPVESIGGCYMTSSTSTGDDDNKDKSTPTPRFIHISSAGVTRPNRPGIDVDAEPPAVKLNDALGGLLTYKLKGEDEIRASGVPFVIIRPVALTEEPAGAELQIDQGDVIKGKISRQDIAELCVELLDMPEAINTTFEIKSTVPFSEPWTEEKAAAVAGRRDWKKVIREAGLKKGVTGKTVNGVYTGKEREDGGGVGEEGGREAAYGSS